MLAGLTHFAPVPILSKIEVVRFFKTHDGHIVSPCVKKNTRNTPQMAPLIATFELDRLSEALKTDWWNKDEFFVFSGPLPPPVVLQVPFRQDYYSFFIVESGSLDVEVDMVRFTVKKNGLFFANPLQVIKIYSHSETVGKLIAFKKEFLDGEIFNPTERMSFIYSGPHLELNAEEAAMIGDLIEQMKTKLVDQTRPNRRQVAINFIGVLLHEIDAIYRLNHGISEKKPTSKETINNQFHNLVSTFFLKERSVKFYADMLNVNTRYLNELTKEITGRNAGDQIDEMVIREAKILLKNTNLSIKQIAEMLHFSDQFSFSKYFKKYVKMSPSEYRDLT